MNRSQSLKRTAIARRTELKRAGALAVRSQMRRRAAAKRTVGKQRRQRDTGPSTATKSLLWARAGGRCELCGFDLNTGASFSRHHRRPRGAGGSSAPWVNDITNLLLLCGTATTPGGCHTRVEQYRTDAYENGWLIRHASSYVPAELPVLLSQGLVYLTSDGFYAKGID